MVNATFDDANSATVSMWKYPDGTAYNPARQTSEFVGALPRYRARGLLAVTLNFQGGRPTAGSGPQPWDNSGFNADGSLKPSYLARLDQAIRALDAQGMVAILGYFYFGQDERLINETAIKQATANATKWVLDQAYRNVLIEIANESDSDQYFHDILRPARVSELITAVQTQSTSYGRRLYVGVSFSGGVIPPLSVAQVEDFILMHGNGQTSLGITSMVNAVRSYGLNKPIMFNEDSTSTDNFRAATNAHASWGYFDPGQNNYVDGFQDPPTNWSINTILKQNFFNLLSSLAASTPRPTSSLVNGGFEGGYIGWVATGDQNIYTTAFAPTTEGGQGIQFNGGQNTPNGVLSQTFATTPGITYNVSFDIGVYSFQSTAEQRARIAVTGLGTLLSQDVSIFGVGTGTAFTHKSFAFTANSVGTTITFTDISPVTTNIDWLLDNVRVR
jgi:hypothetical protein